MTLHHITITPLGKGYYSASIGDRVLVHRSRSPFAAAALAILDDGAAADDIVLMVYSDTGSIALRGRVILIAGLLTIEGETGAARFSFHQHLFADRPPGARVAHPAAFELLPTLH